MRLTAEEESEDTRILLFANVLKDSALTWYFNFSKRAEMQNTSLTLQDYFDEFMRTYEGGLAQTMAEQKLKTLTYKEGECKDLTATNNEFDRLIQELYPGVESSDVALQYAGPHLRRYHSRRRPDSVGESDGRWTAHSGRVEGRSAERLPRHRSEESASSKPHVEWTVRRSALLTSTTRGPPHLPPPPPSSSSYRGGNAVQVKKVGVEEGSHDTDTREEPGNEEELHKTEVNRSTPSPCCP